MGGEEAEKARRRSAGIPRAVCQNTSTGLKEPGANTRDEFSLKGQDPVYELQPVWNALGFKGLMGNTTFMQQ